MLKLIQKRMSAAPKPKPARARTVDPVRKVLPVRPNAPPAADLEQFQDKLRRVTTLKEETRKVYCTQLKRVTEILGQDVLWLLGNSKLATQQLLAASRSDGKQMTDPESAQLLKGLAASVVAVLSHVPGQKEKWPEANENWNTLMRRTAHDIVEKKYEKNKMSPRQTAGFVNWQAVLAKRDQLLVKEPVGRDTLLLCMYTMRDGAARADFGDLRVYRVPEEAVPERGSPMFSEHPNYIVWDTTATAAAPHGSMSLLMHEFKTAKPDHKATPEPLAPALTAVIAASFRAQPRKFVFERPRDHAPYNAKEFSFMANSRLKALFGRPLTLQLLRRSIISFLNFNLMTEEEKATVAAAMMHSTNTQSRYRVADEMVSQEQLRAETATLCASSCADVIAARQASHHTASPPSVPADAKTPVPAKRANLAPKPKTRVGGLTAPRVVNTKPATRPRA